MPVEPSRTERIKAWGVHAFTALGLPLCLIAALALQQGDVETFFAALIAASVVDAVDGTFARRFRVKEVVPEFDGALLDNLIDFLNFAFLPALGLISFNVLPEGWSMLAAVPLLASGYGFCQGAAKTDDAFVGFPSYWNILLLYFVVLDTDPWAAAAAIVLLSVLVFVPLHYIYPSRTRFMMSTTMGLGLLWSIAAIAIALYPQAAWARPVALVSLIYPAYYVVISVVHHQRVHATAS